MADECKVQSHNDIGLRCPGCENQYPEDIMFLQSGEHTVAWCPCGSVFVIDPTAHSKGPKEAYSFYNEGGPKSELER